MSYFDMYFPGDKERRRWPLESEQLLRIKDLPIVALPVAWETQKTQKPDYSFRLWIRSSLGLSGI